MMDHYVEFYSNKQFWLQVVCTSVPLQEPLMIRSHYNLILGFINLLYIIFQSLVAVLKRQDKKGISEINIGIAKHIQK